VVSDPDVQDTRTEGTRTTGNSTTGAVTLEWQPEPADWVQVFAARRRFRRETFKLFVIAAVGAAGALIGMVRHVSVLGTVGLITIVAVLIAWAARPFIVRSFWRQSPALRKHVRAVVDEGGITLRTGDGARQHPWSALGPVLETEQVFVVHLAGGRAFFPLAKRGLSDPADIARLHELLHQACAVRATGDHSSDGRAPAGR
jgi:hypothetical protein